MPKTPSVSNPARESWLPPDAAAGVASPELAPLLSDHWSFTLEEYPVWATRLGVHRFDDRLGDRSEAAIERRRVRAREFLARAEKVDAAKLDDRDATTLRSFVDEARADQATEVCAYELWSLSPRDNPVTEWNELQLVHPLASAKDARNLVARYREIPRLIDEDVKNLERGAKRGLFANAETTRRVIAMLKHELARPTRDWAMLAPLAKPLAGVGATERAGFEHDLTDAVEHGVRPAFERYLALLERRILPNARGPGAEGIGALPNGAACYTAEIQRHTTLERSADELHQLGLDEIERIDAELLAAGRELFGLTTLPDVLARLRDDPTLYFENADEIVAKAEDALSRARAAIPRFFGRLPKTDCVVRRIPEYEAANATIAYYKQPHPDGSKPGEYFVNVLEPRQRPRFEAEVLAFHESIPGHHLQIALAQEQGELPAFRKYGIQSAFTEGWGLYSERLAVEMGLYSGALDRLGLLSFDAWRASRLVVDTGLHARGWTRERAERFMLEHTALTELNVKNEVDRYLSWPGQALAYKVGQLEILRLRAEAEHALGARFRLPAFHDAVLGSGAVSLPELDRQVRRFVAAERARP